MGLARQPTGDSLDYLPEDKFSIQDLNTGDNKEQHELPVLTILASSWRCAPVLEYKTFLHLKVSSTSLESVIFNRRMTESFSPIYLETFHSVCAWTPEWICTASFIIFSFSSSGCTSPEPGQFQTPSSTSAEVGGEKC